MLCDARTTTAADSLQTPSEVSVMPSGVEPTRTWTYDGAVFVLVRPDGFDGPEELHRWEPGDSNFVLAFALPSEMRAAALAPSEHGLLVLSTDEDETARLSRWTPETGLESVTELGTHRLPGPTAFSANVGPMLRVEGERALVNVIADETFDPLARDADAVVAVNLSSSSYALVPVPLSGHAPTINGWLGRAAVLEDQSVCHDGACAVEPFAVSWNLLSHASASPLATGGCVDDRWGTTVTHAWAVEDSLVFVTPVSARSMDVNGTERDLWRSGEIVDALIDGPHLWLSISQDNEEDGTGRNELFEVALDSGDAQRVASLPIDDPRRTVSLSGVIGDRLYLSAPRDDGSRVLEHIQASAG